MRISVSIEGVKPVGPHVWTVNLTSNAVRQLGASSAELGATSVILVDGHAYDEKAGSLSVPINGITVLNIGSSDRVFLIGADESPELEKGNISMENQTPSVADPSPLLTLGDRRLLKEVENFPSPMRNSVETIVNYVRKLDPNGDFKRATKRYVNRSDNFVAIEPQTRNKQLLINVRGPVSTALPTIKTMNGYTAFKLSSPKDLKEVLAAIGSATRKAH